MVRSRMDIIRKAEELGFMPHPNVTIKPGDHYIAWRNGDPELLRCESIQEPELDEIAGLGWIHAENNSNGTVNYAYDTPECVKVTLD